MYENLASSAQRDSIVPKTADDTNSSHFLNISVKLAHIIISLFSIPHVQKEMEVVVFLFLKISIDTTF